MNEISGRNSIIVWQNTVLYIAFHREEHFTVTLYLYEYNYVVFLVSCLGIGPCVLY